ncbi:MAG: phosphotransferase, partial [Planctomycetota bacterium]
MTLNLPPRIGIWRLGPVIHSNELTVIVRSQPIDAAGSPRWDYVTKLALNSTGRQAIERSIAAGASVGHPNVVPILDGEVSGEIPFAVSPMLSGRTMRSVLDDGSRKPLPVALWFVRQISQALSAMHRAGWVHADVKPDNAIVSENGHVTLIDLGFAHAGTLSPS